MKTKLFIIPCLLLTSFVAPSCAPKEDGDINEWVGEYQWVENYCNYCHHYLDGTKRIVNSEVYITGDNLIIYQDKTWRMPDSKDLGPSGTIRCYKNHINLLNFSMDYRIEAKFEFRFIYNELKTHKWLDYHLDESSGRTSGDYDYKDRRVYFKFINKI